MGKLCKIRINDNVYDVDKLRPDDIKSSVVGAKLTDYLDGSILINDEEISISTTNSVNKIGYYVFINIRVDKISDQDVNKIYFIDDQGNERLLQDLSLTMNMMSKEIPWEENKRIRELVESQIVGKGKLYDNVDYAIDKYWDKRVRIYFTISDKVIA
jgi:hypothetical protein